MVLKKFGNFCSSLRESDVDEKEINGGLMFSGSLDRIADIASDSELLSAPIMPTEQTHCYHEMERSKRKRERFGVKLKFTV